jgi:hypothetical protein
MSGSKKCSQCGEMKPLNEFGRHKARKDGHQAACKSCRNDQERKRRAGKHLDECAARNCREPAIQRGGLCPEHAEHERNGTKACNECGQTKPLEDYHKLKASRDGRKDVCKQCRNDQQKKRNAAKALKVCSRLGCKEPPMEPGGICAECDARDRSGVKTCIHCEVTKPLNEFPKHPNARDGHVTVCRSCRNDQAMKRNAAKALKVCSRVGCREPSIKPGGRCAEHDEHHRNGTKECSKCGHTKPLEAYGPDSKVTDGRRSWCKSCMYAAEKIWAAEKIAKVCSRYNCSEPSVEPGGLCAEHDEHERNGTQECNKCRETKPLSGFSPDSTMANGFSGKCRECVNEETRQRMAGTICTHEDGCTNMQAKMGLCTTHYTEQHLAGKICEAEGCESPQARTGLCFPCYTRLLKYGDVNGAGFEWDRETRPTWVYCFVQEEEELVKVGTGDDRRLDFWRKRGWKLLTLVSLPRKQARHLEKAIHAVWFEEMGMTSLYDHGERREGAQEMTDSTEAAVEVALSMIEEAQAIAV